MGNKPKESKEKDVKETLPKEEVKEKKDPRERGQKGSDRRRKQRNKQNKPPKPNPEEKVVKGRNNDASWYSQNEQVLKDAAAISMFTPAGVVRDFGFAKPQETGITGFGVSGVWAIKYWPTCGKSDGSNTAVNFAAKKLYSFVRHANSGHANYDSPDLMEYVLAKSSLDATIAFLQRAYGIIMKYSGSNRYLPQALFAGMNLDYSDIVSHIADFRLFINLMATRLNALAIPFDFPIYKRWVWMNGNIFKDSETDKAQIYFYTPMSTLEFNPTGDYVGCLTHKMLQTGTPLTFSDIRTIVSDLVNKFVTDEDCNIMSGDILKAYSGNNIAQIGMIDENYSVDLYYSLEVLSQIHNTYAYPYDLTNHSDGPIISQDVNGAILVSYKTYPAQVSTTYEIVTADSDKYDSCKAWAYDARFNPSVVMYDIYKNDPQAADHIVATRLTYVEDSIEYDSSNEYVKGELASFGTEVVEEFTVFTIEKNVSGYGYRSYSFHSFNVFDIHQMFSRDFDMLTLFLTQFSKFDYHPRIRIILIGSSDNDDKEQTNINFYGAADIFDTDNYTVLTNLELDKMHLCAVSSELDLKAKEYTK